MIFFILLSFKLDMVEEYRLKSLSFSTWEESICTPLYQPTKPAIFIACMACYWPQLSIDSCCDDGVSADIGNMYEANAFHSPYSSIK